MIAAVIATASGAIVAAAFGDASLAATIAAVGTIANTLLLIKRGHDHRQLRRAITAPRRMIYDQDGRPIGTVLDLTAGRSAWDSWSVQRARRYDDPDSD